MKTTGTKNLKAKKTVSKEIRNRILTDNNFSLELAQLQGISQIALRHQAIRNSDRLTMYICIEFFKKHGYTLEQIFN